MTDLNDNGIKDVSITHSPLVGWRDTYNEETNEAFGRKTKRVSLDRKLEALEAATEEWEQRLLFSSDINQSLIKVLSTFITLRWLVVVGDLLAFSNPTLATFILGSYVVVALVTLIRFVTKPSLFLFGWWLPLVVIGAFVA